MILSPDKGKTGPQFQQKFLQVPDETSLQLPLMKRFLKGQEVKKVGVLEQTKSEARMHFRQGSIEVSDGGALALVGASGRYGYYESVDYTAARLPEGEQRMVVKAFFAHHQGMAIVALCNALGGFLMRQRFHAAPIVRATDVTPEAEAEAMEEAEVAPEVDGDGMGDGDGPGDDRGGDGMEDSGGDAAVRNTGEPCTVDGDCTGPGGNCMTTLSITTPIVLDIPFPGGYCSSTCVATDPDSCGPGAWCLDASGYGGPTGCVKTCTDSTECRESEGYTCSDFMIFTQNFCGPPVSTGP